MAFQLSMYYSDDTKSEYTPKNTVYAEDSHLACFDYDSVIFMALKLFTESEMLQCVFSDPFHVYDQVDDDLFFEDDYHMFSFFKDDKGIIEMKSEKFYFEGTEVDEVGMPYQVFSEFGKLELIIKYKFIDNDFVAIEHIRM